MMFQFNYNDGGREAAGFKGKTGDCVTRGYCYRGTVALQRSV